MILIAHVFNLVFLILNLIMVSVALANPTYFNDVMPVVLFLLGINTLFGIVTLICSEKPWEDL